MIPTHSSQYKNDMITEADPDAPVKLFYMSFADGERPRGSQFLGGLLIPAKTFTGALRASHDTGVNPGGEVRVLLVTKTIDPKWIGRLLTKAEIDEMDQEVV